VQKGAKGPGGVAAGPLNFDHPRTEVCEHLRGVRPRDVRREVEHRQPFERLQSAFLDQRDWRTLPYARENVARSAAGADGAPAGSSYFSWSSFFSNSSVFFLACSTVIFAPFAARLNEISVMLSGLIVVMVLSQPHS
jgi:hypothetical protein